MTLIEVAMSTPRRRRPKRLPRKDARFPAEELRDLALFWARGALSYGQCVAATGLRGGSLYERLAYNLRYAVMDGRLIDVRNVRGWK